jgi:hypothetical protein
VRLGIRAALRSWPLATAQRSGPSASRGPRPRCNQEGAAGPGQGGGRGNGLVVLVVVFVVDGGGQNDCQMKHFSAPWYLRFLHFRSAKSI